MIPRGASNVKSDPDVITALQIGALLGSRHQFQASLAPGAPQGGQDPLRAPVGAALPRAQTSALAGASLGSQLKPPQTQCASSTSPNVYRKP